MKIYPEFSNEINFGGEQVADNIYFGYRAKDNKPIPSNYIFGNLPNGSATIRAANLVLAGKQVATTDQIPTRTDQIAETDEKKYVTDAEKVAWNGKAPANHTHPYAPDNHNHDTAYAPKTHTHNYEPAFNKNNAFNKNFGTTAGTVAQGNHTHTGVTTMKAMYEFVSIGVNISCALKKGAYIVTVVSRNSNGNYTIYHNLGHDNYVVILGTGRRDGSDVIVKVGLIEQTAGYFKVQTSWGDQFHDGGFYATILTF